MKMFIEGVPSDRQLKTANVVLTGEYRRPNKSEKWIHGGSIYDGKAGKNSRSEFRWPTLDC